jgi:hypothetical protein
MFVVTSRFHSLTPVGQPPNLNECYGLVSTVSFGLAQNLNHYRKSDVCEGNLGGLVLLESCDFLGQGGLRILYG